MIWRFFYRIFKYPALSQYSPTNPTITSGFRTPYMLLEYIDHGTGQMLSNTWDAHREDPARRQKLF